MIRDFSVKTIPLLKPCQKFPIGTTSRGDLPDDWDETDLGWYLVRRAELFSIPKSDRLRRKAYENVLRTRQL